jgi:hypothetical protein
MYGAAAYGARYYGYSKYPVWTWFFIRAGIPGILVYADEFGPDYLPAPIKYRWTYFQVDLPKGETLTVWDDFKFPAGIRDEWAEIIRFSYQWNEGGRIEWRGPMYAGYQVPAAWEKWGHHAIAAKMAKFLRAAQNTYSNFYGTPKGPFMPLWVPLSDENPADYNAEMQTWTWEGPDPNTGWAGWQYRALAHLAHYYFLSGDSVAKGVLDNWMAWLSTRILANGAGWKVPSDFVKDTGTYEYNYFSPEFHALIAQAMIFKHWRDGDSVAGEWYRKLLDDLIDNRKNNLGSYPQSSGDIYIWHQGIIGETFGMLLNGRTGGQTLFSLPALQKDKDAFLQLYSFMTTFKGKTRPCALGENWMPLHHFEDKAQQLSEKIWVGNSCGTSEGIGLNLMFALDVALYTGDKTWFKKIAAWLNAKLGLFAKDY